MSTFTLPGAEVQQPVDGSPTPDMANGQAGPAQPDVQNHGTDLANGPAGAMSANAEGQPGATPDDRPKPTSEATTNPNLATPAGSQLSNPVLASSQQTSGQIPASGFSDGRVWVPPPESEARKRFKAKLAKTGLAVTDTKDYAAGSGQTLPPDTGETMEALRRAAVVSGQTSTGDVPSGLSSVQAEQQKPSKLNITSFGPPAQASAKAGPVEPPVSSTTLGQTQSNGKIISYPKPPPERPAAGAKPPQEYPAEMATNGDKGMAEEILKGALLAADGLGDIEIPERENLCGTWMKQGDLGFVFGERGLGKTWLALYFARCLAEGRNIGPWPVEKRRRVLYVDGEMPLDGMRDRDTALRTTNGDLFVLNHEWTFQKASFVLNLSGIMTQKALFELCVHEQFDVVVLDNLSCLFSGMAENDADAWEQVLPWLLDLRRHKIAVVIVHHSGRTGQHMRGTSKREDAAFWVLRLDDVPDHCQDSEGARFVSRFTKARQGTREELEPLDWHFQPEGEATRVTFRSTPTVEVFKQWIRDGLTSCTDVAEEMGISRGQVSKLAKRGEREGWLTIEHRTYKLTGVP